jgi:hypothetical protein
MTYLGTPTIDSRVPYAIGRKILATFGPSGLVFRGAPGAPTDNLPTPKRTGAVTARRRGPI